jgi:uncharacterized protein YecA (UPF0149 family)
VRRLSPHRAEWFLDFFESLRHRHDVVTSSQASGVGRNDPCPCGSEQKFKHCHLDYVVADG